MTAGADEVQDSFSQTAVRADLREGTRVGDKRFVGLCGRGGGCVGGLCGGGDEGVAFGVEDDYGVVR